MRGGLKKRKQKIMPAEPIQAVHKFSIPFDWANAALDEIARRTLSTANCEYLKDIIRQYIPTRTGSIHNDLNHLIDIGQLTSLQQIAEYTGISLNSLTGNPADSSAVESATQLAERLIRPNHLVPPFELITTPSIVAQINSNQSISPGMVVSQDSSGAWVIPSTTEGRPLGIVESTFGEYARVRVGDNEISPREFLGFGYEYPLHPVDRWYHHILPRTWLDAYDQWMITQKAIELRKKHDIRYFDLTDYDLRRYAHDELGYNTNNYSTNRFHVDVVIAKYKRRMNGFRMYNKTLSEHLAEKEIAHLVSEFEAKMKAFKDQCEIWATQNCRKCGRCLALQLPGTWAYTRKSANDLRLLDIYKKMGYSYETVLTLYNAIFNTNEHPCDYHRDFHSQEIEREQAVAAISLGSPCALFLEFVRIPELEEYLADWEELPKVTTKDNLEILL